MLYARPGYGDSTPQPGRLVADAAADVDAILARLRIDEFVTAGWSGGGPHALACAALLPVRCLAAATIAGVAPTGGFAEYLAALFRAALATGIAGWRDDDLAFTKDWGLSLDALGHATPVAIWQGDQDRMVPSAHGAWLAANIPRARAQLRSGQGHLTLMASELGRILDDLLDLAGKSGPGQAVAD